MYSKPKVIMTLFFALFIVSMMIVPYNVRAATIDVYWPGPIQSAITGANPGDTIVVHAGTYLEALYIDKSLTLTADGTVVIQGAQMFTTNYNGAAFSREAVIFVVNASNVVITGFTVEGNGLGPGSSGVIEYIYSSGTISYCTIDSNTVGNMAALGTEARGSALTIDHCTIKDFGRVGAYFVNCTGGIYYSDIIGQTYTTAGLVNYGIEIEPHQGVCNLEIMNNTIHGSDNTFYPEPTWSSAGILVDTWREYYDYPGSTVAILCNDIYGNYYGIEVVSNPALYAHCNNITGNRLYGVMSASDYLGNNYTFDATQNWWGDATGPTHASNPTGTGDAVSDYVTFVPYLIYPACIHYYLTVNVDPTGLTTILGEGWYNAGENVVLTAPSLVDTPFLYWDVDGVSQGNLVNPITVLMDADHTATAHYYVPGVGGEWAPIHVVQFAAPYVALVFLALAALSAGSWRLVRKRW